MDSVTQGRVYRTEFDAADAQGREVHQHRCTSIDRIIQRDADNGGEPVFPFFTVTKDPSRTGLSSERLMVLESIGLAESNGPKTWAVLTTKRHWRCLAD